MTRIADRITVRVEFHGEFEGYRVLEFETGGLFWDDPFVQALARKHDELVRAKALAEIAANGPGDTFRG